MSWVMKKYEFEAAVRAGAPDLLDRLFADIKEDCRVFTELFAKPGSMVLVQHLGSTISYPIQLRYGYHRFRGPSNNGDTHQDASRRIRFREVGDCPTWHYPQQQSTTTRDQRIAFLDESTVSQFFLADFLFSDERLLRSAHTGK